MSDDFGTLVWSGDEGATLLVWDCVNHREQCCYIGQLDTFEGFRDFAKKHHLDFKVLPSKVTYANAQHHAARAAKAQESAVSAST